MRKTWLGTAAILSLAAGLAAPILYFLGVFSEPRFKLVLLVASAGWFVFATLWSGARKEPR
ncbi:MAG: hypothetical protein A2W03_00655 [Candidatus Aminicenantes bacterium RBG_16_63_16]|nr:MAG: hypothetical protein A2W03_00655 [Candidatus Aminicenantes bacterium RBG_16_63_16]